MLLCVQCVTGCSFNRSMLVSVLSAFERHARVASLDVMTCQHDRTLLTTAIRAGSYYQSYHLYSRLHCYYRIVIGTISAKVHVELVTACFQLHGTWLSASGYSSPGCQLPAARHLAVYVYHVGISLLAF